MIAVSSVTGGAAFMKRSRFALYSTVVCIGFLWTGASYISHMYRLQLFFPPDRVDIVVLRWNYVCQALGLGFYAFGLNRFLGKVSNSRTFVLLILADATFMLPALLGAGKSLVLWSGLIMNFFHGTIAAAYLTQLGAFLPKEQRGRAFGYAYGGASLLNYLLSILKDGELMKSQGALCVCLLFAAVNIFLVLRIEEYPKTDIGTAGRRGLAGNHMILLFFTLILMSALGSVGSDFQFQAIADQNVKLELSRSFYSIGLAAAGFASDKSRKLGAVLCYVSLVFPFAQVILRGQPTLIAFAWGLSYVILGFYAVYRAIVFVDLTDAGFRFLPLAALGLAAGRVGEALGTFVPDSALEQPVTGTFVVLALFVPLTFMFFGLYHTMYQRHPEPPHPGTSHTVQDAPRLLEIKCGLTRREGEVMRHLLAGHTNGEIAGMLFVSESTVKFHVGNLLRKTGCSNRAEVGELLERLSAGAFGEASLGENAGRFPPTNRL